MNSEREREREREREQVKAASHTLSLLNLNRKLQQEGEQGIKENRTKTTKQ